jgi:hypothetical protein
MTPDSVPFSVIWYEDPTAAARALGVDVQLPDLGITDRNFWASFDRSAWRNSLKGRVAMSDEELDRSDPDWVPLAVFPTEGAPEHPIELWFDLEDGIVFRCRAGHLGEVARLIQTAAARAGLALSENWPGCVIAMQTAAGAGIPEESETRPIVETAGFRPRQSSWYLAVAPTVH